ncbi:MAG TPA: hypothetical protein PLE15_04795 [Smithellaceae bacterium]|jgi:hypothetical protein|nr:hypothetical protein [Smithellaceae bacterium]
MNIQKRIAAGIVFSLFILFAATGGFAAEEKVSMEQWLKIINPVSPKETPPGQAGKKTDTDAGEPAKPRDTQGIAVTIYWHMADDADVYLNGKPLRKYEPSFKTRPDEAPHPAFSAAATLFDGDVFTVGGRRGGSFGLMLLAVDSTGTIIFQTDSQSWKVYDPGERIDWFNPQVALASPSGPVTVQSDPWYPQKELNAKFGNKALSIWSAPDKTFAYLYGVVSGAGPKAPPLPEEKVADDAGIPDLQDVAPFALQEPLDIHTLSIAQYQGAVTAAMEAFRQTMGELSPEEEKRFSAKWGAYFDYSTPESVAYFNKLNPLLAEFLTLRAAIATAAVEFDGAWEEAVIAAGYESENGIREGLAIAEMQKNQLLTMQARLAQVVKEITAVGNPPDVQEAKKAARKKHQETMKTAKKAIKAEKKREEQKNAQAAKDGKTAAEAPTAASSPATPAAGEKPPEPIVVDRATVDKKYPSSNFSSEMSAKDIERIKKELMQGRTVCYYYCTYDYCEGRAGGLSDGLIYRDGKYIKGNKFGRECTPEEVAAKRRLCREHGKIIGTANLKEDEKKLLPVPAPVETKEIAQTEEDQDDEEIPATDEEKARKENIDFHLANIMIIEKNMAKDQAELAQETDSVRRSALEFRILTARSDIQAEKDLIASLQTGQMIHTRTPFDDYAQAQFINNIKDNQRRMEDFQRTTAALNRLAGMLPGDEAEKAREFIKRQLPLSSMASIDKEKAKNVAGALNEKVQGYYLSAGAREDEKAAWANFGMEAAQNIKTAADTGLTVTSMMGGRGVMIAYQGVTGYVEGGPVEAVSRAAFFYSTPTAVAADAFKGYREGGWKGAAKNAAFTFISSKAFEYGAKKLGGAMGQPAAKTKPTVQEQFAQAQFKQARQDGESLAKAFSRAQGDLDRLGKTGASAAEILKQQKAVRDLAAAVNSSPHAKNFLKYKGDYHSQKAYNANMKANHAEAEARFHQEMQRRGWNKQELKEFRNSASAGSVGMDYDIGLVEKANWVSSGNGKMVRNNWLTQNGKAQTVEKWQTDAQKAWNKAYHDTTGRSAKQSWETVTSSANLESYRDLNLLGADKNKVQSIWAGQSADVTRYKTQHMLHDPALSKMEALQEASRGAAKDMNTKLLPLMEQAKAQGSLSSQALAESKRHWQKVQSVLDAFGKNDLDPITAQRRIRELTGKGIPEVLDDGSFLLESMIKGKK